MNVDQRSLSNIRTNNEQVVEWSLIRFILDSLHKIHKDRIIHSIESAEVTDYEAKQEDDKLPETFHARAEIQILHQGRWKSHPYTINYIHREGKRRVCKTPHLTAALFKDLRDFLHDIYNSSEVDGIITKCHTKDKKDLSEDLVDIPKKWEWKDGKCPEIS